MKSHFYLSFLKHSYLLRKCFTGLFAAIIYIPLSAQNFTTISWSAGAPQQYRVSEAQGRAVNGKLYSFGGFDSQKSGFTPTRRAYVFNPATNSWASIADLPYTPNGTNFGGVTHAGITTDGTDIYIAGGYTSNTAGTGQIFGTKQVYKYIISKNTYTRLPDLPVTVSAGQLEYLGGKLHYMGGTNASRTMDLGSHYVLDLNNLGSGWDTLAPLPNPRHHAGSAVYAGKIYFIGGQHGHDAKLVTQKDVDVYDTLNNTWTKAADLPVPAGANGRGHISSGVAVMGDRILVLGGETVHGTSVNMVSAYSPAANSWQNLTPLPQNRYSGVAGVIDGNIYYTGGSTSTTTYKGVPAASQSINLFPIADAFVRNGSFAAINYGKDTSLIVKSAATSGYTRFSYLKFSLGGVSNVTSAKLRVYGRNIDNTSTISISSYGVNTDSWTEGGITFNNAPAASTSALSSIGINNVSKYYEIDVTSYVKSQLAGDKIVSLLIKDAANANSNLVFNSKEKASNKPQLIVISSASRPGNTTHDLQQVITSAQTILGSDRDLKKPVVYPNPATKRFSIKFPLNYEGNFFLDMADESGRIYTFGKVKLPSGGSTLNMDISRFSLKPGVYFLRINSSAKHEEIKLVIQ